MRYLSSLGEIIPTGWVFVLAMLLIVGWVLFLRWLKRSCYQTVGIRATACLMTLLGLVVWVSQFFVTYPTAGETLLGLLVAVVFLGVAVYAAWPSEPTGMG